MLRDRQWRMEKRFQESLAAVPLDQLRKAQEMTQLQVAEILGVTCVNDPPAPFGSRLNLCPSWWRPRKRGPMLIKVYRSPQEGEARYSPAEVADVEVVPVLGRPDPARICTSIAERSNLSVRMGTRRFTRLTNAFSKKWENHWAAASLWYTFYNFCRVHRSLRVTPAMAAGIADHIWTVRELLEAS